MMLAKFLNEFLRIRELLKVLQLIVEPVHDIDHLIGVDAAVDPEVLKLV